MEEDLKILDKYLKKYEREYVSKKQHELLEAIENVLNELERQQKYNYKLNRENQLLFEENELLKAQNITYEVDNKEVLDALHMLLHCSLKDTEYVTQVGQFNIVSKYIKQLETENQQLKKGINSLMQSKKKWKDRYYKLKTENSNISRELLHRTNELNDSIPKQVILDLIEANLEKENGNYICDSNPCQTLVRHLIRIIRR